MTQVVSATPDATGKNSASYAIKGRISRACRSGVSNRVARQKRRFFTKTGGTVAETLDIAIRSGSSWSLRIVRRHI